MTSGRSVFRRVVVLSTRGDEVVLPKGGTNMGKMGVIGRMGHIPGIGIGGLPWTWAAPLAMPWSGLRFEGGVIKIGL